MDNEIPKGVKVNYPAGKGDKDTRTNPRKYRQAELWDNFGPDTRRKQLPAPTKEGE